MMRLHACCFAAVLAASAFPPGASSADRPNVLLVTLDTTRADRLGAYGYLDAVTPAFDDLAARGVLFERAFTSAPLTLPAHATLLTGREPPEHGLHVNGEGRLPDDVPTLASLLQERGYATGAFVAAFVLNRKFGLDRGFDVYDDALDDAAPQPVPEPLSVFRPGRTVVSAALTWLETVADSGRPFLCWVHLYDAHQPYAVDDEAPPRFRGRASYDGDIAYADRQLARLIAFLDDRDLRQHTVVVVVGDHGEGLSDHGEVEHGFLLNREVMRVPLVIAHPGVVAAGSRVPGVTSMRDLLPTILGQLGIRRPSGARGRDLGAALAGGVMDGAMSYGETDMPYSAYRWSPMRSLTTGRWRYVRSPIPELYDHDDDPAERYNVASERPEKIAKLEALLQRFERSLGRRTATAVPLDPEERRRLEMIGYLVPTGQAPASGSDPTLPDMKVMLPVKHLETSLTRGLVTGAMDAATARAVAEELVARSPGTPLFRRNLATMLAESGARPAAAAHLREALRLDPGAAELRVQLAGLLREDGSGDEAVIQYEAAIAAAPASIEPHLGLGTLLVERGDLAGARRHFELAVERDDDSGVALLNLANTLALMGDVEGAILRYRAAVRLDPGSPAVHQGLAEALALGGRLDEAVAEWTNVLRLDPSYLPAHARLASARAARGDFVGALVHREEAARIAPQDPRHLANLAWLLATAGDPSVRNPRQAVALSRRVMELLGPDHALSYDVLAAAYAADGRMAHAVRAAERGRMLALQSGDAQLAGEIGERLASYNAGRPYIQLVRPPAP